MSKCSCLSGVIISYRTYVRNFKFERVISLVGRERPRETHIQRERERERGRERKGERGRETIEQQLCAGDWVNAIAS